MPEKWVSPGKKGGKIKIKVMPTKKRKDPK